MSLVHENKAVGTNICKACDACGWLEEAVRVDMLGTTYKELNEPEGRVEQCILIALSTLAYSSSPIILLYHGMYHQAAVQQNQCAAEYQDDSIEQCLTKRRFKVEILRLAKGWTYVCPTVRLIIGRSKDLCLRISRITRNARICYGCQRWSVFHIPAL